MRTSQEVKTIEESFVRSTGAGECFSACSRHGDVALRATATLRSRVAHARRDQALCLEAIERGVQRTRGDGASRTIRQFGANRHAVCAVAESQNRQEDQLFELAEIHRTYHLNCIVVQIRELSSCATWRDCGRGRRPVRG
jgi:hypothetical protein